MALIDFLSIDDVLQIHADQIQLYGGSHGLRDRGLLESAVEAPQASFGGQFLNQDLYEMAAVLLVGIVKNHPFIDGNKRTGTTAALSFLDLNGMEVPPREPDLSSLVLAVDSSQAGKVEVADFLRQNARPRSLP